MAIGIIEAAAYIYILVCRVVVKVVVCGQIIPYIHGALNLIPQHLIRHIVREVDIPVFTQFHAVDEQQHTILGACRQAVGLLYLMYRQIQLIDLLRAVRSSVVIDSIVIRTLFCQGITTPYVIAIRANRILLYRLNRYGLYRQIQGVADTIAARTTVLQGVVVRTGCCYRLSAP